MILDLHNHTSDGSPDSHISARDLFLLAKAYRIDGVGITEHGTFKSNSAVEAASSLTGVRAFQGIELNSAIGHLVVYGPSSFSWLDRDDKEPEIDARVVMALIQGRQTVKLSELRNALAANVISGALPDIFEETRRAGGCVVYAHPFAYAGENVRSLHHFLKQWLAQGVRTGNGLTDFLKYIEEVDPDTLRWIESVDAIETQNGLTTNLQNVLAKALAEELGRPQTAGSDTHSVLLAGRSLTTCDEEVANVAELCSAIRSRRVRITYPGPEVPFETVVELFKSITWPAERAS